MTAPVEPLLPVADVQGDILAGFRKDHEDFVFLRFGDVSAAKRALRRLAPRISPLKDVAAFNALFRSMRARRGEIRGTLAVTWVNVAFSAPGLRALTSGEDVERFEDVPFKNGLAKRSAFLGDPTDAGAPGHPASWVVGGPHNEADAVLLVAGDDERQMGRTTDKLVALLVRGGGFELLYHQRCATRADRPGHEHFGFRDGISQPAPRGRLSKAKEDFLAPRVVDPADARALRFARPGQPLVWPGQFVLGLPRQAVPPADDLEPMPAVTPAPAWATHGSFLVIRRLQQDVAAFRSFLRKQAAVLEAGGGFDGLDAGRLAALLVGRWPSGAPLIRAAAVDDVALGQDDLASNDFGYANARAPTPLRPTTGHPPDTYPPAVADPIGAVCPQAAHIRKLNPRDQGTDQGGPRATLRRLLLRRGIPYGRSFDAAPDDTDRGLMFAAYQASIDDQFEFVTTDWVNHELNPTGGPAGLDLIIGQKQGRRTRRRTCTLLRDDGRSAKVTAETEWVIPTGGGYFFAPSISALRRVLSA